MKKAAAKEQTASHEVRDRILSGLVLIVVMLVLAYAGGWALYVAVTLCVAISVWEICGVLAARGGKPIAWMGMVAGAALLLDAQFGWHAVLAALLLLAVLAILLLPRFTATTTADLVFTFGAALYVGLLAGYALLIRALPPNERGFQWLFLVLASVGAADVGAYAVGSLFGKHRLAPRISPRKTWEGFAGGALACLVVVFFLSAVFGLLRPAGAVVLALTIAVCDVLGDLAASTLKRYAGVKNYGNLIPGHGGMMDRIDGVLVALPVAYAVIQVMFR